MRAECSKNTCLYKPAADVNYDEYMKLNNVLSLFTDLLLGFVAATSGTDFC